MSKRPQRTSIAFASAGPVKVIAADGSTRTQPAYSEADLSRIDGRARRRPRTWDEINSARGGGSDATFVT